MTIEQETRESEAQAIEGYACGCGFRTPDVVKFRGHMLATSKDRENHPSLGRVNFDTGEVIMPPGKDRSPAQWKEAKYGRKVETESDRTGKTSTGESGKTKADSRKITEKSASKAGITTTEILAQAMQIKFVPRVYTIDYSPILRAGQDASIRYWGWRPNMPLGNFIDTVVYLFFKEKGITLAGYIIEETEEEKLTREAAIQKFKKEMVAIQEEEVPV